MDYRALISEAHSALPLPSVINAEEFEMPLVRVKEIDNHGVITVVSVTYLMEFKKDYVDGICVGWKFSS